tara:strand:- start:7825 stop:8088 length:264 start_codon:yes stop_codon:yes gene_type:complete
MKLFVYKTLFVVVCIFLLFQLTVGAKLKQFEEKFANYKSQENIENIKNKIRKELKNAVEKENYLSAEDAKLINQFLNKLKKELSKGD